MPGYDLHTHTTFSDGTTSPERNVELALDRALDGLAVTDHDTTGAWERSLAAADGSGLEIVPGVELSAEQDGFSVHVLGYWFDPDDPDLVAEMDRIVNERQRRAEQIVAKFNDLGVPVDLARVRELAGEAPIGRPHLATAVVETGAASDLDEVFERWLHDGGPAYVPKYAASPERCVGLIVAAGGAAVLAHPALYGPNADPEEGRSGTGVSDDTIAAMAEAGLAGIEADHPDHEDDQRAHYRDLARSLGLVVTAGSDFHGERKDLQLGNATVTRERLEQLRARVPTGARRPSA